MTAPALLPVFVLSLPRAGSTLLQRVLAAHDGVATTSEPWILLPWLGPLAVQDKGGWDAEQRLHRALIDFAAALPGGLDDYRRAVHDAALTLYREVAGPAARVFIDKSPPYAAIADEVARTFPEAPLVFLWRHPLAVVVSYLETYGGGRWRPCDYPASLFGGVDGLLTAQQRHGDRAISVRYEQLVAGDEALWREICAHIGIEFEPTALDRFTDVALHGTMGDSTGVRRYGELSEASVDRWKLAVSTPLRKAWCRRYLSWLGAARLARMGYELDELLAELEAIEPRGGSNLSDGLDTASSLLRSAVKAQIQRTGPGQPWRGLLAPRNDARAGSG